MFNPFSKSKKSEKSKKARPAKKSSAGKSSKQKSDIEAEPHPAKKSAAKSKQKIDAKSSLERAQQALDSDVAKKGKGTKEREKLIRQAMAVHQAQSRLLDELDDDTKQKLRTLALEKMVLSRFDDQK